MINVEKIKQLLSSIWQWVKKYAGILLAVIGSIIGYLFGRNRSRADFESIRNQLQQYKQQLQSAERELQSLRGIKQNADKRITELEGELAKSEQSVDSLITGLHSDGSILDESRDIFTATERDIQSLRQSINELRKYLQQDGE